jgi:hypothetical protein
VCNDSACEFVKSTELPPNPPGLYALMFGTGVTAGHTYVRENCYSFWSYSNKELTVTFHIIKYISHQLLADRLKLQSKKMGVLCNIYVNERNIIKL